MKKIAFLTLCLMTAVAGAMAQDRIAVISTTDGAQKTVPLDEIKSITHGPNKWTAYAKGTYHYCVDMDGSVFTDFPLEQDLTLYRYDADPRRWKLTGWGPAGVDFTFFYDEDLTVDDVGQVIVDHIDTGVTSDYYGDVIVSDYLTYYYYGEEGAWSVYNSDTATFNFVLVYSSGLGFGIFAEGNETFEITEFLDTEHEPEGDSYMMSVNYTDGTNDLFNAAEVTSVTYTTDGWELYAKGTYNYNDELLFHGSEDLLVYRNTANPTSFYIADWGLGQEKVNFQFTYTESTGEVYVPLQDTGYTSSSGHSYSVEDVVSRNDGNTYYGTSYYSEVYQPEIPGYWDTDPEMPGNEIWVGGTPETPAHSFAFNLMYVPDNGGYAQGYEIFTLTEWY